MKLDTSKKLSEILIEVLREDGTTSLMLEKRAEMLWQTVLGPTVNNATSSVRVRDGVMHVGLTSSVIRNELFHMRGTIIAALNKAIGENVIKEIQFH